MNKFLAQKNARVQDHSSYSLDLTHMRLFLYQILNSVITGNRHDSRNILMVAIYQCLKDIPIKDYQKMLSKLG